MTGDSKKPGDDGRDLLSELLDLEDEATQMLESEGEAFEQKTPVDSIMATGAQTSSTMDADLELFEDLDGLTDLMIKDPKQSPSPAKTPIPAKPPTSQNAQHEDFGVTEFLIKGPGISNEVPPPSEVTSDGFEDDVDEVSGTVLESPLDQVQSFADLGDEDVVSDHTEIEAASSAPLFDEKNFNSSSKSAPADDVDASAFEEVNRESQSLESKLFGGAVNSASGFEDAVREKTVVLDMNQEMDATVNSEVDPLQEELNRIASEGGDEIDSALAGFEQVSRPNSPAPGSNDSSISSENPDKQIRELSQDDFADVFASGPIQVSQVKNALEQTGGIRRGWMRIAGFAGAGLGVAAGLFGIILVLRSESGVMGYRLEGFSIVEAYHPPSPEDLAKFQQVFDKTKKLIDQDNPTGLSENVNELKAVLENDRRNLEAATWIMFASARLQEWEGAGSRWSQEFDVAYNKVDAIRNESKSTDRDDLRQWAKLSRQVGIGDFKNFDVQIEALNKSLSNDSSFQDFVARSLFLMGRTDDAQRAVAKIKTPSRALEFLKARASNNVDVMEKLARGSYLPAQIHIELSSVSGSSDSAGDLKRIDEILEKVKAYPQLAATVKDRKGDYLAAAKDDVGARKEWEESLKVRPDNLKTVIKLADSYERELLWDKAIESMDSAVRLSNNDRSLSLRYIRLLRDRMKIVEALGFTEKLIAKNAKDSELLYEKGLTQLKIFQEEPAKISFQAALENNPKYEPAILSLASIATRQQDWQDAERLFKLVPETSENYSLALLGLGNMAFNRYRLDDAQKYFALAIKNNPRTESAYDGLVRLLLRKEEDAKASGIVSEGERALPQSGMLAVARARIFGFQRNFDQAFATLDPFKNKLEHDLDYQFARIDLLLDAQKFTDASAALEVLGKREIVDPEFHYLKAKLLLLQDVEAGGNREAASRAISAALRTRPETEKYLLAKAKIDLEVDDRQQAAETVNQLLNLYPDNAQAYLVRGDSQFEEGNYAQAIDSYSKALQYTRFVGETYRKLAVLYKATGQSKKAIEFYTKVVATSPRDAEAHLELGKLYVDAVRPSKAKEHFMLATSINPALSEAYYHLGYIHKEMGQNKMAVREFEKYLSRNPDSVEAATVRDEIFFLKQQAN